MKIEYIIGDATAPVGTGPKLIVHICNDIGALEARRLEASVHMPRIGCGLAGGDWQVIGQIVEEELVNAAVPVTVYDLPG